MGETSVNQKNRNCTLSLIIGVILFIPQTLLIEVDSCPIWTGPWVDNIVYEVMIDESQRVYSLLDGDVDIIGSQIDVRFLPQLNEREDIEVNEILRYGYGIMQIDCTKYPLNLTGFRRAIAFSLNKTRIIEEAWLGYAELLDCHIPQQHPACIDNEMQYHYYDANVEEGNRILDDLGFFDVNDDGWRESPNGTILPELIVGGYSDLTINVTLDIIIDAFHDLKIRASKELLRTHAFKPDMMCFGHNWNGIWRYEQIFHRGTDYFDEIYDSLTWVNETWGNLAKSLQTTYDYDEIVQIRKQMEHIWVAECPSIILYQNYYHTAYRTDYFEGVVVDIFSGAPNFYTNVEIHRKYDDIVGGTYTYASPRDILSFNPFSENSYFAEHILQLIYDPMVRIGPDGQDLQWMVDSFQIETHSDNPLVDEGHMRITTNLIQNASWSDGSPITAEDVSFTLNLLLTSEAYSFNDLRDMVSCYALNTYQFVAEFGTESFWHWRSIAYKPILPRQIWLEYSENPDEYQPSPATIHDMIVSGPFKPQAWVQGDFLELQNNPDYFDRPWNETYPYTSTISQSTSSSSSAASTQNEYLTILINSWGIISAITIVVLVILVQKWKEK